MNPNSLALRPIEQGDWTVMREQANVLIKTGFLPESIKTPEQAIAIMMKGRELNLPPMYSLSNIVVIKGKPAASAELMLAIIYRDHGDDAIRFIETTANLCTISYKRRSWTARQSYSFTTDDAKAAGLLENNTWRQYRPAMLRARCVSAVARMAFPDTIGGLYTPEELGGSVSIGELEEPTIHVPQTVISANTDTGEIEERPTGEASRSSRLAAPAESAPPPMAAPAKRPMTAEQRYDELLDKADVLGLPAEHRVSSWSRETLIEKGKALHQAIQERELAAMGSSK